MKKLFVLFSLFTNSLLFSQDTNKPKTLNSFYAGIQYSAMRDNSTYPGLFAGIQTLIKDTHVVTVEINHVFNSWFKANPGEINKNTVISETNYEITYGRIIAGKANPTKLIIQSGLRLQYIKYQDLYIYNSVNGWLFSEPIYVKKALWQASLPVKLLILRLGKHTGKSLGTYVNIGKYAEVGMQIAFHLFK